MNQCTSREANVNPIQCQLGSVNLRNVSSQDHTIHVFLVVSVYIKGHTLYTQKISTVNG